ncbi:uncharacterized protein [Glycine max]|uniref:uncharacterized protein n=1 Tax=Glycine max TaxID=3847 RepID=UPI0003DECC43|nr:uncharacterized protein LOC102660353 [Glycine max]|eukprot:XP_006579219.1 uncharacterized protein LOC102660353 [Glycine max]
MEKKKEVVPNNGKEAPYPLVLSKKDKERYFACFLEIFKKLEITIPFGEALQQMPLYTKFLKDLLSKKGKYIHSENIMVEGNYSAFIQRFLPPKCIDLGSITIPCSIGVVSVGKTLIDLGAIINLMPLSMCRRIGNLEILPTRMTLQLADRSITRPYGVVEDVLVKVRHFTFPVDFVIMDIEEDVEIPLILGRPFMLTAKCVVDMGNGNLKMSVDYQKVTFNLFDAIKHPSDHNACFKMEKVEHEVAMVARAMVLQSPLENVLTSVVDCLTKEEEKELQKCLEELDGLKGGPSEKVVFEELKKDIPTEKATVELKILPEHLRYVFLEEKEASPVVISNSLTDEEESRLVEVLKKHKAAIGWHISDLKGISPSYYMHKINMEAEYKPVR